MPSFAADRPPGLIGEHLALIAENLVDDEGVVGRRDADSAGDSTGRAFDGKHLSQRHAKGRGPGAAACAKEDAFAGQHKQAHFPGVPPVHHPQDSLGATEGGLKSGHMDIRALIGDHDSRRRHHVRAQVVPSQTLVDGGRP